MKTLVYPLIFLCVSIASASAQTGNYEARMEDMLVCYDNANNAAGRRVALDSMFTIDKKYLGEAFKKMWAELDEKTATGADCRRVGIAMAAGREKKAHKWCFRKGAELGDPYCANRVLIEQLEELNYPEAALYLYPKLKSYTLPLLHNLALALYVLDTPESRKLAKPLAEKFFKLYNNPDTKFDVYDYREYIDYFDTDILKAAGRCWQVSHSKLLVGPSKYLRDRLEQDK